MGGEVSKALFYLFVLGVILLLVGFYVGSTNLAATIFSGVNTLDLTATGRDAQGNFSAYPALAH